MQSKTALAIAACLLLLISALGFYNIKISSASIKKEVQVSNTVAASASAEFIKRDIDNLLERTQLMLAHSDLIDAVTNRDEEQAKKILSLFVTLGARIDRAFITSPEGNLWTDYPDEPDPLARDYSRREWFQGIKETGQPFISDVYRRPVFPHQEVVTIARYIRNSSGEVIGYLGFHYRLNAIDKLIEGIAIKSESEKIVLLDSAGMVVAPYSPRMENDKNLFENLEPFKQALRGKEWTGEFTDPVSNEESMGTFFPIHLNNGNKTWVVVSSRTKADAFAPVVRIQNQLAVTSLLLFLATAAGAFAVLQSNKSADKLNAELDKSNRDLELRVAARTEELITIINASPNYVFYKDCNDIILRINEPAARSIGKTPKEVEGRPSKDFYPPDEADEYHKADMQVIESGKPLLNIVENYTLGSGEKRWVRTDKIPYRDEFGDIIGVMVFAQDITDVKRHEDELRQLAAREHEARLESDRLSHIKDEFLITLSHELRTPLVPILGWLELIEKSPAMKKEDLKAALGIIERNARAELGLVEELLDNSRIISGKLLIESCPVELLELTTATVESTRLAADSKNIELRMEVVSNPGIVSGDSKRLGQVLWNLLSNSVKFTPPNGKITIRVSRGDGIAMIEVKDTGIGIDSEFLPHVFDRFHQADSSTTRKFGGLGLGLALAKHLVEAHGGTLRAESQGEGLGSTFTVELPNTILSEHIYDRSLDGLNKYCTNLDDTQNQLLANLKILVVDDNPDDRVMMHAFLSSQGAEVVTAGSAKEGFELISSCKPDLLLSDIGMPGEDGISLIRKVRSMTSAEGSIPAIALTAYGQPEDKLKTTNAGFDLHITKPVNSVKLAHVIRELMT